MCMLRSVETLNVTCTVGRMIVRGCCVCCSRAGQEYIYKWIKTIIILITWKTIIGLKSRDWQQDDEWQRHESRSLDLE